MVLLVLNINTLFPGLIFFLKDEHFISGSVTEDPGGR